jgi:signal transduction histidine kinase
VLYLENTHSTHVFTPARLAVLKLLASQAAVALENARLFAELRQAQADVTDAQRLMNTGGYSYNTVTGDLHCSSEMKRINELDQGAKASLEACFERIHPDDRESVRQVMGRKWGHGETFDCDYRLQTKAGSLKYIHSVGRASVDEAGGLTISGTAMDVTAFKVAQLKLQSSLQELSRVARITTIGELTVSIAHEVNQPLMSIVTNAAACARWLAEGNLNVEEARSAAERIVREGHRAGDILESIRALTRKSASVISAVDFNAVINEVLELMRAELRERRICVETMLQPDLAAISGDRVQLQQVMLNLIKNAAEAMSATHDRARTLRVRSRVCPDNRLLVSVVDTGPGIDPEAMPQIFEAFFTTKADGIGLGLSICRSIVEAHRGQLSAKSNVPHGSTFQFSLPIVQ